MKSTINSTNDNPNEMPLLDADGHLQNHLDWSTEVAQLLANTIDVELMTTHLQILMAVRDFYTTYEYAPATRPLIKYLTKSLPELPINNAYLQQQFNTGLVARHLSRLAGLPKPANCL